MLRQMVEPVVKEREANAAFVALGPAGRDRFIEGLLATPPKEQE